MIRIAVLLASAAFLVSPPPTGAQPVEPEITFAAPATVAEGDDGFTEVDVTWKLSAAAVGTVTFDVELPADGDAPADWETLPPTPVVIPAGTTNGIVTVRVVG